MRHPILLLFFCACAVGAVAQFNTPAINGSLDANTYGGTGNPNNYASGPQTWYMTWDNTNLYLFISSANIAEGAVVYFDINPFVPVNGGSNANGTLVAQVYDGSGANPPFRADAVIYFKNGYRELRLANGSGGWGSATAGVGSYADAGSNRELSIPWSSLTGSGRPAAFNWFGYVTSSGGFVFGQAPVFNPSGTIGTSSNHPRYFSVVSTATGQDGAVPNPAIGRESYTFLGGTDITSFGAVTLHDLTINNSGRFLSRGSGGGNWSIGGTLVVNAGTLYFGSSGSFGTTAVGNLRITGGTLDMDNTNQAMNVSDSVLITGGTLQLSNTLGGDLNLSRNWNRSGGTFTPRNRAVGFVGTVDQRIQNAETFDFVSVNKSSGELQLTNNTSVAQGLTLTSGNLNLQGYTVTLGSSSSTASLTTGANRAYNGTFTRFFNASTAALTVPSYFGSLNRSATITFALANAAGTFVSIRHTDYSASGIHPGLDATTFPVAGVAAVASPLQVAPFIWTITSNATQPYSITLSGFGLPTVSVPDSLRILKRSSGGSYTLAGTVGSVSGTAGNYTVTSTNITGFSEFTFANAGIEALPVTWLSVRARRGETGASIEWTTASELNNERFEVERASAPSFATYQVVGQLPGRGTTSLAYTYRLVDADLPTGPLYYRIRQVDYDGRSTRSPIVSLETKSADWTVYPTILGAGPLNIVALGEAPEWVHARIVTADGRELWSGHGTQAEATIQIDRSLRSAASGLYLLQLITPAGQRSIRLVRP